MVIWLLQIASRRCSPELVIARSALLLLLPAGDFVIGVLSDIDGTWSALPKCPPGALWAASATSGKHSRLQIDISTSTAAPVALALMQARV